MSDLRLVSYCGLYCGTCFLLQDRVPDQALALLEKFKELEFEKWGKGLAAINPEMKAFEHVDECYQVLAAWDHMRCPVPCREGGGSQACAIRTCCQTKQLPGCWACTDLHVCPHLEALKQVNGTINQKNLQFICEQGVDAFIQTQQDKKIREFYSEE